MISKNDNTIRMIKGQYENVATALYLVTNHLKDTEPLKNRVREISHQILEQMIHLSDISYVHVESHTSHLQSLLKIASSAGLIAEQNASILNQALQKTLKDMQHYMKSLTNMSISLSDLLYIEPANESANEISEDSSHTHQQPAIRNMGTHVSPNINPKQINHPISHSEATHKALPKMSFDSVASMRQAFNNINKDNGSTDPVGSKTAQQPDGRLTDRQQIIIKELRNKGQLSVKDISEKIKGCSEKTIQRELLSLVGAGVLKKEGERRWSRYSLQ